MTAPELSPPAFTDPAPTGRVLVRDDAWRWIDLETGRASKPIGQLTLRDRLLQLVDGRLLCACLSIVESPRGQLVEVRLDPIDDGRRIHTGVLLSVEAAVDPLVAPEERTEFADITAAAAPDGTLVAIGVAVRRAPVWSRSILIVDVETGGIVDTVELEPVASHLPTAESHRATEPSTAAIPGAGQDAWPPAVRFAPDGRHLLVSATVISASGSTEQHWIAEVEPDGVEALLPLPSVGTASDGQCGWGWPAFADASMVFAICRDDTGPGPRLRRLDLDGSVIGEDVDLRGSLGDGWGYQLVDQESGTLFDWDPFSGRAARVDLRTGRVVAAVTVASPIGSSQLDPLVIGRVVAGWIAPTALAKTLIESPIVRSSDGSRLYVLAVGGEATLGAGLGGAIHVLDAATLQRLDSWPVQADLLSIGLSTDGRWLIASGFLGPGVGDPSGAAEASITVHDALTGQVRAMLDGLGHDPVQLVDPATIGR